MADRWLVAYDIADDARRRDVATACEDAGQRWQHSVFVCTCSPERIDALQRTLRRILNPAADHVFIAPLCARCQTNQEHHGVPDDLEATGGPVVI